MIGLTLYFPWLLFLGQNHIKRITVRITVVILQCIPISNCCTTKLICANYTSKFLIKKKKNSMAFSIFTVLHNHHIYLAPTHFQNHKSPHSLSSHSLPPNSKQPWQPPICFYEFTYPGYFIQIKHTIYEFLHLTSFP